MAVDHSELFLRSILRQISSLVARDKLKLIAALTEQLQYDITNPEKKPHEPIYGIMKGIGPSPSLEDFEEIRRDMMAGSLKAAVPEDAPR